MSSSSTRKSADVAVGQRTLVESWLQKSINALTFGGV
jgi:hypothetical protein